MRSRGIYCFPVLCSFEACGKEGFKRTKRKETLLDNRKLCRSTTWTIANGLELTVDPGLKATNMPNNVLSNSKSIANNLHIYFRELPSHLCKMLIEPSFNWAMSRMGMWSCLLRRHISVVIGVINRPILGFVCRQSQFRVYIFRSHRVRRSSYIIPRYH